MQRREMGVDYLANVEKSAVQDQFAGFNPKILAIVK